MVLINYKKSWLNNDEEKIMVVFGKLVLVMRDTTERPEGITAGTLKLVGTNEDNIYNTFRLLLEDKNEYEK